MFFFSKNWWMLGTLCSKHASDPALALPSYRALNETNATGFLLVCWLIIWPTCKGKTPLFKEISWVTPVLELLCHAPHVSGTRLCADVEELSAEHEHIQNTARCRPFSHWGLKEQQGNLALLLHSFILLHSPHSSCIMSTFQGNARNWKTPLSFTLTILLEWLCGCVSQCGGVFLLCKRVSN